MIRRKYTNEIMDKRKKEKGIRAPIKGRVVGGVLFQTKADVEHNPILV